MKIQKKTYTVLGVLISAITFTVGGAIGAESNQQPKYMDYDRAQQAVRHADVQAQQASSELLSQLDRVRDAERHLMEMQHQGDDARLMEARTRFKSEKRQYVSMLSRMSGVAETEVSAMHGAGVSWESMAHELGLETRTRSQMSEQDRKDMEVMQATAADLQHGWTAEHGIHLTTGNGQHHMMGGGNHQNSMMAGAGGLSNGLGMAGAGSHDGSGGHGGPGGSGGSGGGMGSAGSSGGMGGGMGGGGNSGGGSGGGMH